MSTVTAEELEPGMVTYWWGDMIEVLSKPKPASQSHLKGQIAVRLRDCLGGGNYSEPYDMIAPPSKTFDVLDIYEFGLAPGYEYTIGGDLVTRIDERGVLVEGDFDSELITEDGCSLVDGDGSWDYPRISGRERDGLVKVQMLSVAPVRVYRRVPVEVEKADDYRVEVE